MKDKLLYIPNLPSNRLNLPRYGFTGISSRRRCKSLCVWERWRFSEVTRSSIDAVFISHDIWFKAGSSCSEHRKQDKSVALFTKTNTHQEKQQQFSSTLVARLLFENKHGGFVSVRSCLASKVAFRVVQPTTNLNSYLSQKMVNAVTEKIRNLDLSSNISWSGLRCLSRHTIDRSPVLTHKNQGLSFLSQASKEHQGKRKHYPIKY